jgi:lipopolysaccharide biosynthesis glycosyltransferase
MTPWPIFIGHDPREPDGFAVTQFTMQLHGHGLFDTRALRLDELQRSGLYTRPVLRTVNANGALQLFDTISDKPMATEFAISRFFVPALCGYKGMAVFADCDMMVRRDMRKLIGLIDPTKAVSVVKHDHRPTSDVKMEGQVQTSYARKNWSSFIVFNCEHPANAALTPEVCNTARGLWLHQFSWLTEDLIGSLPVAWNWLAGHSYAGIDPANVHYTDGGPWLPQYRDAPYADEWRAARAACPSEA